MPWPRAVHAVVPRSLLLPLSLVAALAAAPATAQGADCEDHLGAQDGCDCGCGAPDPDCGEPPVELGECEYDACALGSVPSTADPSTCRVNACGDGYVAGAERCDDGNTTDEGGCAPDCSHVESGWLCGTRAEGCRRERCGDGVLTVSERCDDGNALAGDGCAPDCTDEPGFICYPAQPCRRTLCGDLYPEYDPTSRTGETCDDGNQTTGDGCDRCESEPGWYCPIWGGTCTETSCGNGVVEGDPYYRVGETCDDMNDNPDDGCDQCVAAPGAICWNGPCHFVACGDGYVDFDGLSALESCDDGNASSGDGCSSECQLEPGFDCASVPAGQPCIEVRCGDGIISYDQFGYPEACDDGNEQSGDGCPADCSYPEAGYICETPGQPCRQPVCGDGERDRDLIYGTVLEECDDANTASGDGCSSSCSAEGGFECVTEGEPCIELPPGWECSMSFFGTGDGCDCGCGSPDPDCTTATAAECAFNHCFDDDEDEVDPCDPSQCLSEDDAEEARCSFDGGGGGGGPLLRCDARASGHGADGASLALLAALGALTLRPLGSRRDRAHAARATTSGGATAGR